MAACASGRIGGGSGGGEGGNKCLGPSNMAIRANSKHGYIMSSVVPHPPALDIHVTQACQVRLFSLIFWKFVVRMFIDNISGAFSKFCYWQKSIWVSCWMSPNQLSFFP